VDSWWRKSVLKAMAVKESIPRKEKEAVEKMLKENSSSSLTFSAKFREWGALTPIPRSAEPASPTGADHEAKE
jgi:hypothetical protein